MGINWDLRQTCPNGHEQTSNRDFNGAEHLRVIEYELQGTSSLLHLRLHESTSQICDNCYYIFFIGHSHLELIFELLRFRGFKLSSGICSGTVSGRRFLQFIHLEIFNFFFLLYL